LRDIAAEAAISVDQGGARTRARGGKRRREAAGAAADDEYIGFQNDIDRAGDLSNLLHFRYLDVGRRQYSPRAAGSSVVTRNGSVTDSCLNLFNFAVIVCMFSATDVGVDCGWQRRTTISMALGAS
jgi:hypothetical protein